MLPLENHGGRDKVERQGQLCERKNGRGVDINRNWDVDWGKKEADYSAFEEAPGMSAFSEPETQIVRDLAREFEPHAWLTIHSGVPCCVAGSGVAAWAQAVAGMMHCCVRSLELPGCSQHIIGSFTASCLHAVTDQPGCRHARALYAL